MKLSDRGIVALLQHEGIVPGPYKDSVGVWTVYIGHTQSAGAPDPVKMPRGQPLDIDAALREAFAVFRRDIATYEAAVTRALRWPVQQHEFDALVSFHYNTGAIARAQITVHINAGDKVAAADAFRGWRKPPEIIPRRTAEENLFRMGRYPTGKITVWGVTASGNVVWKPLRTLTETEALAYLRPPTSTPVAASPNAETNSNPIIAIMALLRAIFSRKT